MHDCKSFTEGRTFLGKFRPSGKMSRGGWEVVGGFCPPEFVTPKLSGVRVQPKLSGDTFPGGGTRILLAREWNGRPPLPPSAPRLLQLMLGFADTLFPRDFSLRMHGSLDRVLAAMPGVLPPHLPAKECTENLRLPPRCLLFFKYFYSPPFF